MLGFNNFPLGCEAQTIACDTETYTYIDGEKVSTEELQRIFCAHDHNITWAREHVSVRAWAWICSDGEHLAILPDFESWCRFCCEHAVHNVWWYNAKFDWSFIDYEILTTGWQRSEKKRLAPMEYSSLHGDQGQRYKLSLCRDFPRRGRKASDRHSRPHTWHNFDFMNLFQGGLAANLESFHVTDYHGNPIRKLEMDYQLGEDDENAFAYMANDAHGLFHLVRIASEFLEERTGYSLFDRNMKLLTAGGLAKRMLLRSFYGQTDLENVRTFKRVHRMTVDLDKFVREYKLYNGGKTIVNPDFINREFHGKIFYYDRNSMYPAEMSIMPDLVGGLMEITPEYEQFYRDNGYQIIYMLQNYCFHCGDGCLPIFYDPFTKKYVEQFSYSDYKNRPFLIFDFELDMIGKFYTEIFRFQKAGIYAIKKNYNSGIAEYVKTWYDMKAEAKKKKDGVLSAFAKLLLNSSYGKLSQNCERQKSHREINPDTGAVHVVDDDREIDESCILSVVMGAYITARARCALCDFMIELCGSADNTRAHIFYCDTDSVQTDLEYSNADAFTLGGWKLEKGSPFTFGKWLAPKTYLLYSPETGYTVHSKGVQAKTLQAIFTPSVPLSEAGDIFSPGKEFQSLSGLNVRGGKALLPLLKQLCREDNIIAVDDTNLYNERL